MTRDNKIGLTEKELQEHKDFGKIPEPKVVHTPIRARYIIFYRAITVPKEIRSGFLDLTEAFKYVLTHLESKPDHIYDVIQRKVIWEMMYPND